MSFTPLIARQGETKSPDCVCAKSKIADSWKEMPSTPTLKLRIDSALSLFLLSLSPSLLSPTFSPSTDIDTDIARALLTMAKGSSSVWIDQLVSLLDLDKETVKTQIIPFLDSFDDEASLRTHLQGLVGTDTPLAKSFVRDFTRSRFPQQSSTSSETNTTTARSAPAAASSSNAQGATQKKRGKKTLAERAGIGQTLAPRKLEDAGMDEEEQMAKLAEAFGGMGTVYRKKQGEDEFFAGVGKGKKARQPASSKSGAATPSDTEHLPEPAQPESTAVVDSQPAEQISHNATSYDDPSSTSAAAKSQPAPAPTAEMLAIDAVVKELTSTTPLPSVTSSSSTSSGTINRKLCFCQGRKHALAPYAPLCYSCGLILCSAIHPSPLSPLSSCPSCHSTPLLSAAARSDIVAKLTAEREILFEQQLLQIQIQREMKMLNKATTRTATEEEAALFPTLGGNTGAGGGSGGSTGMQLHTGPVMGKHGALQKAKAIAGDAQRTAKVLSLDMKTHKVKSHTKVAKPKPTAKEEVKEKEVVVVVEQDPFVGLDGVALVKNEADDGMKEGLRGGVKSNGKGKAGKGQKGIPTRMWTFGNQQLTLRA